MFHRLLRKAFRKYCDRVENYRSINQQITRFMDTPTLKIQTLLEETLVRELHGLGEHRAAAWLQLIQDTWTGELGNCTNSSAGYCGTLTSAGCEVSSRYMLRDTQTARHYRDMLYYAASVHARLWPMHG